VVANNDLNTPKAETVAQRVRRLQAEAKQLAKDHIHALTAAISEVERMAAEIAEGGDAYPAGVRDLARRFAEDADARVQTLEAITART
jgi:predicted ATP-dependent protease